MVNFELETVEKMKKKMEFWKDTLLVIGSYIILLGIAFVVTNDILLGVICFVLGAITLYYRKKKYIDNRYINDENALAKNTYLLCGWVFVLSAISHIFDGMILAVLINGAIGVGILYYRNRKYISKEK